MAYPGVPEELQSKMSKCVSTMTKDGQTESAAIAMCKLSLLNQKVPKEKEKPYRVVESQDTHYVFNSSSKIDASQEGTVIKNIEIFKAGTFKGIEFKLSSLDKMVANFYFLKSHGTFPNVPVRADHPGWMDGGKIDQVGGYIKDLRRVGKKLVADIRVTSDKMLENIKNGTYINRSSEIGMYTDNDGVTFDPILYGFAWVDIPAVEGLSPKFSFSKDGNVTLINLNQEIMGEEIKEFPPKEEEKVETPVEKAEEEVKEEEVKETEVKTELSKKVEVTEFSKAFPAEAAELEKFRAAKFESFVAGLVSEGKVLPAQQEKELAFAKSLSTEQFAAYEAIKKESPKLVQLDQEEIKAEEPKKEAEVEAPKPVEEAEKFIEETK